MDGTGRLPRPPCASHGADRLSPAVAAGRALRWYCRARFVPEGEDPMTAIMSDSPAAVPLVDLDPLATPEGTEEVGRAIREAGRTVGFFSVANHAVPQGTVWRALAAPADFRSDNAPE